MDPIPQHGNENDPLTDSGLSPPIQLLNIALSAMFSKISFPKFLIVHADLNRIQNLSLKDHNQKLILEAEEFKNRFKDTFLANFGGSGMLQKSLTAPMNHPDRSVNTWTFPNQKVSVSLITS
ncbi:hypothetical protein Tco_0057468, partial [Tanacetum coccineum]